MFKCTGNCSDCGRCKSGASMKSVIDRKSRLALYPEDFCPQKGQGLGVAFDVGTTTVVGMMWDLKQGKQRAVCAKTNPQNEFGADVISRIEFCGKKKENFALLRKRILDCMADIISELCIAAGAESGDIRKICVGGNTTMSHIISGYSPLSLAQAPFLPAYAGTMELDAGKILPDIADGVKLTVIPNIAGHVGGDITAGILAARLMEAKGLTIFIDIGTNGEIVIADGRKLYACSTAAGPVFEGAAVLYGMRASEGAIERVFIQDGSVHFETIGACQPQGICGSGLIDAVAQMLKHGLISKKGRIISRDTAVRRGYSPEICERIVDNENGRCFVLAARSDGDDIIITQNDIREVQMAKGAVKAGITILLHKTGNTSDNIERVMVAGAFGSHIDKRNAVEIGLLPDIDSEKIQYVGNAAGAGASMFLMSEAERAYAENLAESIRHVELARENEFQNIYLKSMGF